MHAEIIAIGDELTSGQSLDTNTQWLAQRLEELGLATLYHSTVGDQLGPCVDVFRQAFERADIVIVTGGLGPTDDDLTREALAKATGYELTVYAEVLERIREIFSRRGWPMPPQNERQALIPVGGRTIRNPFGTAPGIDLKIGRDGRTPCRVFALPGMPAEMFEMWQESVSPAIERFLESERRVIRRRQINCFGAGESRIEEMLPGLIRRDRRPTVGITAGQSTISLRIAADGANEQECIETIEPVAEQIHQRLGTLVFGEEDDQLQDAVARLLLASGKTLATAECATAGQVAMWLAGVDNSADFYRGGMVLSKLDESVEQAAVRCREQFGADYGLAIGVPSPTGEAVKNLPSPCGRGVGGEGVEDNDLLQVPIALATADGAIARDIPCVSHPSLRQVFVAKQALNLVRLALLK